MDLKPPRAVHWPRAASGQRILREVELTTGRVGGVQGRVAAQPWEPASYAPLARTGHCVGPACLCAPSSCLLTSSRLVGCCLCPVPSELCGLSGFLGASTFEACTLHNRVLLLCLACRIVSAVAAGTRLASLSVAPVRCPALGGRCRSICRMNVCLIPPAIALR